MRPHGGRMRRTRHLFRWSGWRVDEREAGNGEHRQAGDLDDRHYGRGSLDEAVTGDVDGKGDGEKRHAECGYSEQGTVEMRIWSV